MTNRPRIELGKLVRPVGLRGELRLLPAADFWPEALTSRRLTLESHAGSRPATILRNRPSGNCIVVKIDGVEDRNAAEELRNVILVLSGEPDVELPDAPLPFQIIGMTVVDTNGERIGEAVDLLEMPAQALLRVKRTTGGESDIPFIEPIVRGIDWDAGVIEVDPPAGLFDL